MFESIQLIILLLVSSVLTVALFRYLRLAPMIAYFVVGLLLGPYAFGILPDSESSRHFVEFGIVFLMFTIGLEFSLPKLNSMRHILFGLGGTQVLITLATTIIFSTFLGLDLAEAFIIGEKFINGDDVTLILGDNIFHGSEISKDLNKLSQEKCMGAKIFAYKVPDPQRYGVVEFDSNLSILSIEEKPLNPKTSYAVTGLYVYDSKVCTLAKSLTPSDRGELEITDLNNLYLKERELNVSLLDSGTAWLDAGTPDSLIEAAHFVQAIQNRQSIQVGCIEEIAFNQGFISINDLKKIADLAPKNKYGDYIRSIAEQN